MDWARSAHPRSRSTPEKPLQIATQTFYSGVWPLLNPIATKAAINCTFQLAKILSPPARRLHLEGQCLFKSDKASATGPFTERVEAKGYGGIIIPKTIRRPIGWRIPNKSGLGQSWKADRGTDPVVSNRAWGSQMRLRRFLVKQNPALVFRKKLSVNHRLLIALTRRLRPL